MQHLAPVPGVGLLAADPNPDLRASTNTTETKDKKKEGHEGPSGVCS